MIHGLVVATTFLKGLLVCLYIYIYLFIYDFFKMFSVTHIMLLKGRIICLLTEAHSICVHRITVTTSVM